MLKDEADFVLIGFEFPQLEGRNLEHHFSLVRNPILNVRKFQNSVKKASERKEIYIGKILLKNGKR